MPARVLIVGQGLAGTFLAWEFSRAGIPFDIADRGHATAASRIGTGMVNPITGQRLVKSWRIESWQTEALPRYRAIEEALSTKLVRPMRVRRFFRDERERLVFEQKRERGDLAPFLVDADEDGLWIGGAAHVDLPALLAGSREWLREKGRLVEDEISPDQMEGDYSLAIFCTGAGICEHLPHVAQSRLAPAKGQVLRLRPEGSTGWTHDRDLVLNRGHWALPFDDGTVKVGATFEREFDSVEPTAAARRELEASAAALIGAPFSVLSHEAGVRLTTADRRPILGRLPGNPALGVFNGFGSKGALLVPCFASHWVKHLRDGAGFDPEVDVARFLK